jgi:hypothetical protein
LAVLLTVGANGRLRAELSVERCLGDYEAQLLLGVDGAIAIVEQLDRELGEGAAVTAKLARLLQRGLPLLGLDAILLVGTILANARDLNEPSHQNSVAEMTCDRYPRS